MSTDLRSLLSRILRWCVVLLLLSFAWQTIVSAKSSEEEPAAKEALEEAPKKKAPPGPVDEFDRGVPRTSVKGYLDALRQNDYVRAAEYLDLRNLQQGLSASDGHFLARKLGIVFSRALWIELDLLSNDPQGHSDDGQPSYRDYVDSIETDDGRVDILLQLVPRGDGVSIWKFSNATVRQVPELYDEYGYSPLSEKLLRIFPEGRFLGLYVWQWAFLVLLILGPGSLPSSSHGWQECWSASGDAPSASTGPDSSTVPCVFSPPC